MNKLNAVLAGGWLLAIGAFATLYIKFYNVTHTIVIHFDAIKGIDFLGTRGDAMRIGLLGLAFVVANTVLVKLFEHRERMLAWAIAGATLGIALLELLAAIVIVVNN